MTHNHIAWLLFKHQRNELTPDEQVQLDGWLNAAPVNRERFNNYYTNAGWMRTELTAFRNINVAAGKRKADRLLRKHRLKKIAGYTGGAIVILIAAGLLFWPRPVHKATTPTIVQKPAGQSELKMDSGKAYLTIDEDTTIELQNAKDGLIAQKGNLQVIKEGRRIRCTGASSNGPTAPIALKLVTSWASQWELQLQDNSHIWLNAVSSVRYPAPNSALARSVQLEGEGYFEIAHDASRPFDVTAGINTEVVVSGTKFNIKAYPGEGPIKASLIEGQIKVIRGREQKILKPGESAFVWPQQPIEVFPDSTIENSIAWKQGSFFVFNRESKSSIIKQLERWYHVKINYAEESGELYNGTISRAQSVDGVLQMIFDDEVQIIHKEREITLIPRINAKKHSNN